ncbi:MAG: DUF1571 domain-containing protein [Planctomycetes bacterium]|nr:DUF1571 domain-containing protein [Planctomycetota bacterium]
MRNQMSFHRASKFVASAALVVLILSTVAWAQSNLTEPVYRVAAETDKASTTPATPVAVATPAPAAAAAPLDFTRQGEEHPLMPVIRGLQTGQEVLDKSIRDYSCTFFKQERIDGELGEQQQIYLKVMHQPFSVYMFFKQPHAGREVVYVQGQNDNKLVVLDAGVKRFLGKMTLDVNGALAMKGQRHPITSVGIRNLSAKLVKVFEGETKYGECEVSTNANTKINGRPTTMVQIFHPQPRQNFRWHVARLFFDNELKIPIHFDAYLWPEQPGGKPPLEESYTYQNLKINNNFTALQFDPNNNPEIFKQ